MIDWLKNIVKNLGNVVLTFTRPAGVTWLVIGFSTGFELTQNFMILTLGIVGIKTWKRIEKIKKGDAI